MMEKILCPLLHIYYLKDGDGRSFSELEVERQDFLLLSGTNGVDEIQYFENRKK